MFPNKLFLVRHGETAWNREGRFVGHSDPGLNETGYIQARKVAKLLSGQSINAIFCSDLRRAVETADTIAGEHRNIRIQVLPSLREMNFGIWEGLTFAEIEKSYPQFLNQWLQDQFGIRIPSGESANDLLLRVQESWRFISEVTQGEGAIVIVAHGGTLRFLANYLTGIDPSEQWAFNPGHGELVSLCRTDACPVLPKQSTQCYQVDHHALSPGTGISPVPPGD